MWTKNYKLTLATFYKKKLYKMLYRWHFPPAKLAKMFPNTLNKCWKCKNHEGTYYHAWWTCDKARKYWVKIHMWIKLMPKQEIEFKPEIFLLGLLANNMNTQSSYLILHVLTAARLVQAQLWKEGSPPKDDMNIKKILECAELDRLTKRLKGQEKSTFYISWNLFYDWWKAKVP